MRSMWRRAIALILIPLVVTGCYSWQLAEPTPSEYLETHHPERVRLTQGDGSTITLWNPELRGDSLRGGTGGGMAQWDTIRAVTIGLTDVERMEVHRFSARRTMVLVAIPFAVLAIAIIASCGSSPGESYSVC